ncbi:MAG: nucleotidyltransferase domain-containing protein [Deltaproteobacteria bacterium]|nr:nucleotidyltransferase domain-containing protein [Deltaproteobacteria bacterium]MBI3296478.1 nucleotidyltransferase domain-containing protein [Deltaproteobacteria bacterium]
MSEEIQKKLDEAVKLLVEACHPERIILFGSYARGTQKEDSDLDLMVVEKTVKSRADEMVRLCRVLSPLLLGVDLIVVDSKMFEAEREVSGVYQEASTDGKVLYEAA